MRQIRSPSSVINMQQLGFTRSANRADHILQTPDTFVRSVLPGMRDTAAIVHVAPVRGARFTQYTAELEPGGTLGPASAQRFVFVLNGMADVATDTSFQSLLVGGYAYIPAELPHTVTAQTTTRLVVIEKIYQPLAGVAATLVGSIYTGLKGVLGH